MLQRIGQVACRDPNIMKLLSFVVLFSGDSALDELEPDEARQVEEKQGEVIKVLQRAISGTT